MAPNWDTADGPGFLTVSLVASPWAPILHPQGFQTSTKVIMALPKPNKKMDQSKNLPAQGNSRNFHFKKEGVFDHVCLRCAEISKPGQGKLRSLFAPNDTIRYSAESKHRSLLSTSQIFGTPPNLPSWFSSPNCWQSLIGPPIRHVKPAKINHIGFP